MTDETQQQVETTTKYGIEIRVCLDEGATDAANVASTRIWGPWRRVVDHFNSPTEALDTRDRLRTRFRKQPDQREIRAVKKVTTTEVLER